MKRLVWLLLLAACGGSRARPDTPATEDEHLLDEKAELPAPPQPPAPPSGTVTRAALDGALAAGPGALLAQVKVEPVRGPGGFRGWRLLSVPPNAVGLEAGDVLLRVNGKTLERPEHLSALYEALRGANQITVDSERGGAQRTVTVPIVE